MEETIEKQLDELQAACDVKQKELTLAIKAQTASGDAGPPNESVRLLMAQSRKAKADFLRGIRRLQRSFGISESEIRAFERAEDQKHRSLGEDYWHHQIVDTEGTDDLDELASKGLEQLTTLVNPEWLSSEGKKKHRLDNSFLSRPLQLVSGVRLGVNPEGEGPSRFARMLLICQDYLRDRPDHDFFSAAMFVPEIAALGNSIKELAALGPEAHRKVASLSSLSDDAVTSTIYELLVGAACVRSGLNVEMVQADLSRKSPDFRISGIGPMAGSIECKRRLGPTVYELEEARIVKSFYDVIRESFRDSGFHCSIEVSFSGPIKFVVPAEFVADVTSALRQDFDRELKSTNWGTIAAKRLPYCGNLAKTRLYSTDYLEKVFEWKQDQNEWDGLVCEVEPPSQIIVRSFKLPFCLKWKSESPEALIKKARGITSLWADAVKQIPDGDLGFLYIAYPESARPVVADARTTHLITSSKEYWHRWSVRIPFTIVNRLYSRTLGEGSPDLIENSILLIEKGHDYWLDKMPLLVFTRPSQK